MCELMLAESIARHFYTVTADAEGISLRRRAGPGARAHGECAPTRVIRAAVDLLAAIIGGVLTFADRLLRVVGHARIAWFSFLLQPFSVGQIAARIAFADRRLRRANIILADVVIVRPALIAVILSIQSTLANRERDEEQGPQRQPGRKKPTFLSFSPTSSDRFQRLDLETHRGCRYDRVSAFEGRSLNASDEIGRYCGSHGIDVSGGDGGEEATALPPVLKSRGRIMTLQFKTDGSVAGRG